MTAWTPFAGKTDPAPTGTRRHAAELVFVQQPDRWVRDDQGNLQALGRWSGRLFTRGARDRQDHRNGTDLRLRYRAEISEQPDGSFRYVTQGREPGGRRYGYAATLTEAQTDLIKWAARRFFVEY